MTYYTTIESPIQPILLTSDGESLTGLFMIEHKHGPEIQADWVQNAAAAPFPEAKRQLAEYFAGARQIFDIPLAPHGTEFQQKVWKELRGIPFGKTLSYGELARTIGSPGASRAVGMANGRNPISIIVPCHRVIGANGKLTGYGGGLPRKAALLERETKSLADS